MPTESSHKNAEDDPGSRPTLIGLGVTGKPALPIVVPQAVLDKTYGEPDPELIAKLPAFLRPFTVGVGPLTLHLIELGKQAGDKLSTIFHIETRPSFLQRLSAIKNSLLHFLSLKVTNLFHHQSNEITQPDDTGSAAPPASLSQEAPLDEDFEIALSLHTRSDDTLKKFSIRKVGRLLARSDANAYRNALPVSKSNRARARRRK